MSRQVNASAELSAAFYSGLDGLLERVGASGSADAQAFTAAVDVFMYDHGSRGPNEWDPYSWSYGSRPALLLQAINHARGATADADPDRTVAAGAAERQRLIDHFSEVFADNAEEASTRASLVGSSRTASSSRVGLGPPRPQVRPHVRQARLRALVRR